ncbi:hypothetical protein D9758_005375 [Tetrapyrgos nigripes]|uniref:SCP domain-containing protein n=1 Tax=Tetrapyrgos nigripes TaxID=182062 RepID=A0A8H5GHY4_9AGAR|nr:hypothetical protein D9758_005375 [Tetrapyrgos nigripes]
MVKLTFLSTLLIALSVVPGGLSQYQPINVSSGRALSSDHRRHWKRAHVHMARLDSCSKARRSPRPGILDTLGLSGGNGYNDGIQQPSGSQQSSSSGSSAPAPAPSSSSPDAGLYPFTTLVDNHLTLQNSAGNNSQAASSLSPTGSDSWQQIQQAWLDSHNSVRAKFGAGNLQWNDTLAAAAQTWSNKCVFEHSHGLLGAFGENLAAGTGDYTIQQAAKAWADESSQYDHNNPQYSHFTQMVWKSTTQVGCALTECTGIFDPSFGPAKFYTCEYYPQGNVISQFGWNVGA